MVTKRNRRLLATLAMVLIILGACILSSKINILSGTTHADAYDGNAYFKPNNDDYNLIKNHIKSTAKIKYDYPDAQDAHEAYDRCLIEAIVSGDDYLTVADKCNSGSAPGAYDSLADAWCKELGFPPEGIVLAFYRPDLPEDLRCFNAIDREATKLTKQYGSVQQQEAYSISEVAPKFTPDDSKTLNELQINATNGNADAQNKLGVLYSQGKELPEDFIEAFKWFHRSAEQRYAKGEYNLAQSYRLGKGIPRSYETAMQWYRAAANQGYAPAQTAIGTMYSAGTGRVKDQDEAIRWFRMAAEQGYIPAEIKLGAVYGMDQNMAEASKWLQKAADQGSEEARDMLDRVKKAAALPIEKTNIKINQEINAGECAGSTKNGKPVKVCMDHSGGYKLLPISENKINVTPAQLLGRKANLVCFNIERAMPPSELDIDEEKHLAQVSVGSPKTYSNALNADYDDHTITFDWIRQFEPDSIGDIIGKPYEHFIFYRRNLEMITAFSKQPWRQMTEEEQLAAVSEGNYEKCRLKGTEFSAEEKDKFFRPLMK